MLSLSELEVVVLLASSLGGVPAKENLMLISICEQGENPRALKTHVMLRMNRILYK